MKKLNEPLFLIKMKKMKDEEFWDELDQFLKDWEDFDKLKDEFCNEMTVSLASYFLEENENNNLNKEEFVESCKKETKYIAEDFFYFLSDLLHHYEEETTDFLSVEDITPSRPKPMDFTELRKMPDEYPHITHKHIEKSIKEEEESFFIRTKYLDNFHNLVKKEITDYLYNMEKLPARAFRELDFVCYQKMNDFEFKMDEIAHSYSPYKFDEDELPFDK